MSSPGGIKIWLLQLVPEHRFGRWFTATAIFSIGVALFGLGVYLNTGSAPAGRSYVYWPVALFFVSAVAYIVPVFHYITSRTQHAVDRLAPHITSSERVAAIRHSLKHRTLSWTVRTTLVGIAAWLAQSRLLAGSWEMMIRSVSDGFTHIVMDFGSLPVWITMVAAMSALFRNALTIRALTDDLNVQILEPDSYMPIGSMAVSSTLVVLGALGLLCVMWLGGPINWWSTLPALIVFVPMLVLLLLLPVLPVHRKLITLRQQALNDAQAAIRSATTESNNVTADTAAALSLRREVSRLSTWPFDVPAMVRFVVYAIIVPLTWAGAALIEMLVNAVLD